MSSLNEPIDDSTMDYSVTLSSRLQTSIPDLETTDVSSPCSFHGFGCPVMVKKHQLKDHLKDNVDYHLNLLTGLVKDQQKDIIKLKNQLLDLKKLPRQEPPQLASPSQEKPSQSVKQNTPPTPVSQSDSNAPPPNAQPQLPQPRRNLCRQRRIGALRKMRFLFWVCILLAVLTCYLNTRMINDIDKIRSASGERSKSRSDESVLHSDSFVYLCWDNRFWKTHFEGGQFTHQAVGAKASHKDNKIHFQGLHSTQCSAEFRNRLVGFEITCVGSAPFLSKSFQFLNADRKLRTAMLMDDKLLVMAPVSQKEIQYKDWRFKDRSVTVDPYDASFLESNKRFSSVRGLYNRHVLESISHRDWNGNKLVTKIRNDQYFEVEETRRRGKKINYSENTLFYLNWDRVPCFCITPIQSLTCYCKESS